MPYLCTKSLHFVVYMSWNPNLPGASKSRLPVVEAETSQEHMIIDRQPIATLEEMIENCNMVDLSKEITVEGGSPYIEGDTPLGEGGFGVVRRGRWNDRLVRPCRSQADSISQC
jgi:hypothetical protein